MSICDIVEIDSKIPDFQEEGIIEVTLLSASRIKVVQTKEFYKRGPLKPQFYYGVLRETIKFSDSKLGETKMKKYTFDSAESSKEYLSPSSPKRKELERPVYVVKCETTEDGKRQLTKVLREELHIYNPVHFFRATTH